MKVRVSAHRTAMVLLGVVAFLAAANVLADIVAYLADSSVIFPLFNVGLDANVPTWYSSLSILLCSAVMLYVSAAVRNASEPYHLHWFGLAVVFLLMSVDEVARIHETVAEALGAALVEQDSAITASSPLFYSTWMIPALLFVIAFGIFYARFVLSLPRGTKFLFIAAGLVYLSGAMGMEAVGDVITAASGGDVSSISGRIALAVATLLEETLEMVGILVFLYALISYAKRFRQGISITFTD